MSLGSSSCSSSVREGVGDMGELRTETDASTGGRSKARGGDEVGAKEGRA